MEDNLIKFKELQKILLESINFDFDIDSKISISDNYSAIYFSNKSNNKSIMLVETTDFFSFNVIYEESLSYLNGDFFNIKNLKNIFSLSFGNGIFSYRKANGLSSLLYFFDIDDSLTKLNYINDINILSFSKREFSISKDNFLLLKNLKVTTDNQISLNKNLNLSIDDFTLLINSFLALNEENDYLMKTLLYNAKKYDTNSFYNYNNRKFQAFNKLLEVKFEIDNNNISYIFNGTRYELPIDFSNSISLINDFSNFNLNEIQPFVISIFDEFLNKNRLEFLLKNKR